MKVKLCPNIRTYGICFWLYGSLGRDLYLSLPHLASQECCEVSCVQIYVGAEHYKLKMSLTKFNVDLSMHVFSVKKRLLYRKETLGPVANIQEWF